MKIFHSIEALAEIEAPLVLAAGVFDGLHIGHQAVLRAAVESASRLDGVAVLLTFDPHPATVLRPERSPALLTPLESKLRLVEGHGIHHALVIPFDSAFAAIEPEDFVTRILKAAPGLVGICIGEGWKFGRERRGDARLLQTLGMKNGFFTSATAPVVMDSEIVSSTLIRESIASGDLPKAARLLGRNFTVAGRVEHGEGVGAKLGFPTANIDTGNQQLPCDGVYAVRVMIDGNTHDGVANIGIRPTVSSTSRRVLEVHLFDFQGDLYGREIEIAFLRFLRHEQKFDSLEALRAQIHKDAEAARDWLRNSVPNA